MKPCNHERTKVRANFSYMTNPSQTPWICSNCGARGIDTPKSPQGPTYEEILKKFGKEDTP